MTKQQFLSALRRKLAYLPQEELEERLNFYGEMVDDRMEEGLCEEEAVAAAGSVDDFVLPEKSRPKNRLCWWEISLLVLGSPVWLSLLIAVTAVIFALAVSVWACFVSVAASALICLVAGTFRAFESLSGVAFLAAGAVCAGIAILLFFACTAMTKYLWNLPGKLLKRRNHHA